MGKSDSLSRNDAVGMGIAPAPGAAGRALAARIERAMCKRFGGGRSVRVRREGAPNHSRGGCAPPRLTASFRLRNGAVGNRELRSAAPVGQRFQPVREFTNVNTKRFGQTSVHFPLPTALQGGTGRMPVLPSTASFRLSQAVWRPRWRIPGLIPWAGLAL